MLHASTVDEPIRRTQSQIRYYTAVYDLYIHVPDDLRLRSTTHSAQSRGIIREAGAEDARVYYYCTHDQSSLDGRTAGDQNVSPEQTMPTWTHATKPSFLATVQALRVHRSL